MAKKLALTFDDGPCPLDMPLLDILAYHRVPSTFFCTGSHLEMFPTIAQQIVRAGHVLGNHSYNHPDLTTLSQFKIEEQIDKTEKAMFSAVGMSWGLFRAPYVHTSKLVQHVVKSRNLTEVMWDAAGHDWREGYTEADIVKNVKDELGDKDTGILLLHDTIKVTRDAVETLVIHYQDNGYEFVTVREVLQCLVTSPR